MRYFRDPLLTFWTATALMLGGLLALALHLGNPATQPTPTPTTAATHDAAHQIRTQMPALLRHTNEPGPDLADWATDTAQLADNHTNTFTAHPQLANTYQQLTTQLENLAELATTLDTPATDQQRQQVLHAARDIYQTTDQLTLHTHQATTRTAR